MSDILLHAENLTIAFGEVRALSDVSLTIRKGEIRCLAGENGSGKSTFVKIVSGVYAQDTGTVSIDGDETASRDPRAAIDAGVQVIYQDLSLFDHLTVAENIAINRMLHDNTKMVRRAEIERIAREQLAKMNVSLPLHDYASTLSVANRQLVAIARALSMDAKILFMDEPTTALTTREVARLLTIVRELKEDGLAIVFISHKLDEIFDVADTITVFRDGEKVGDYAAEDLTPASLSKAMTGREVLYKTFHRNDDVDTEQVPLLKVTGLTNKKFYRDISFTLQRGDILGLTGLLGSGRTELALSLFGLNRANRGVIEVNGKKVSIDAPWDALALGIALVPEDRGTQALFGNQSMRFNLSSSRLGSLTNRWGAIDRRREREMAENAIDTMRVNNRNLSALVRILSGGNQQKVVIGKWLATEPQILILDSPTVGIDIGSKSEIYDNIHALAHQGIGVILISDEPEEIYANCNKVLVMHEGDIVARYSDEERLAPGFAEELASVISAPAQEILRGAK